MSHSYNDVLEAMAESERKNAAELAALRAQVAGLTRVVDAAKDMRDRNKSLCDSLPIYYESLPGEIDTAIDSIARFDAALAEAAG